MYNTTINQGITPPIAFNALTSIISARAHIAPPKPKLGDLTACQHYAHLATQQSTRPFHTSAFIWTRFIDRSFIGHQSPSTVAMFNDGIGKTGIDLSQAKAGIHAFLKGDVQ